MSTAYNPKPRPWYKRAGCFGGCVAAFDSAMTEVDKEMDQEYTVTYEVEGKLPKKTGSRFPGRRRTLSRVSNLPRSTSRVASLYGGKVVSESISSGEAVWADCSVTTSDLDQ